MTSCVTTFFNYIALYFKLNTIYLELNPDLLFSLQETKLIKIFFKQRVELILATYWLNFIAKGKYLKVKSFFSLLFILF